MGTYCCKVGRTIDRYGIEHRAIGGDLDEYLLARWLGKDSFPETGVRPLKDTLNRKLLETVYERTDRRTTETQLESYYNALTNDDKIRRGEVLDDIDEVLSSDSNAPVGSAEALVDDFVSSSTLYRHLTGCLDGEKQNRSNAASNWEEEKIAYAKAALSDNVESALQSLENKGRLPDATAAEIDIPVILGCPVCSTQVRFERAINRGYICGEHMKAVEDSEHDSDTAAGTDKRNKDDTE